jgi:hypothetical protein
LVVVLVVTAVAARRRGYLISANPQLLLFVDIILDPPEHGQELIPVEFEAADVLFHLPGDLVDASEKRELPFTQRIENLAFPRADSEDAPTIADEMQMTQVVVHVAIATQVVPRSSHPLQRHTVIEQASHDPQRDQIPKRVETANTGATAGPLDAGAN